MSGEGVTVESRKVESLPHGEVLKELFVKADVMEATTDPPSVINNALQKRSTQGDHFTREL